MAHNRGLLRPTPTPQKPRQTGHAPLQAGARSTRGGLRVGVVDSLGGDFVWGAEQRAKKQSSYSLPAIQSGWSRVRENMSLTIKKIILCTKTAATY